MQEYAARLVLGTLARRAELDEKLSERSEHWRLGRMAAVDRNLLRLALYELLYENDTPDAVVIDEAVEIAKKFSTPSSGPFVNGVLDGIRRATYGPRTSARGGPHVRRLALLLALAASAAGAEGPPAEWALYRVEGASPWRFARPVEDAGYRVVLSSPDGRALEARVEVDGAPFGTDAPFPPPLRSLSPEARAVLAEPRGEDALARCRVAPRSRRGHVHPRGRRAGRRVHVARGRVHAAGRERDRLGRPALGPWLLRGPLPSRGGAPVACGRPDAAGHGPPRRRRAEGADAGIPPRLQPAPRWRAPSLDRGVRPVARLGALGPGGLANTVTARHLALARQPASAFRADVLGRSAEVRRPALESADGRVTLARPRGPLEGASFDPAPLAAPRPAGRGERR